MSNKSFLSSLTFMTIGLGSKAFLNYLCADVKVVGLPRFLDELDSIQPHRKGKKGMLTYSNHISSCVPIILPYKTYMDSRHRLDDPLAWGVLPASYYLHSRTRRLRWALGASDTCFTNPLFSNLLHSGQVLETFRGQGVRQKVVDRAIQLLNAGEWVHIFPEGLVAHPPHTNLRRLKWGIGRILAEVDELPTIIPMWLTGFDEVSVDADSTSRLIPRPGKRVSIIFGEQDALLKRRITSLRTDHSRRMPSPPPPPPHLCDDVGKAKAAEEEELWTGITRVVQEELESLGGQVSGVVKDGVKETKGRKERR